MKQFLFFLSLIMVFTSCTTSPFASGTGDWVVMVDSQRVSTDEFLYMLTKNQADSSLSRQEIDDYLKLYTNFKLKVTAARLNGYDTLTDLREEFLSYKDQLLRPYMGFEHLNDSLVSEAYQRSLSEIRASHILVSTTGKPESEALKEIVQIRAMALGGEDFGDLAKTYSEDPSASINGGDLGYFSAFRMVYPFEIAAYSTEVGEISEPVKTQFGYHIIKVTDQRPVRDQLKLAHILLRTSASDDQKKKLIEKIYADLQDGADWEKMCLQYSEDPNTKKLGGELPWISAGRTIPIFEEVAYSLKEVGQISEPVLTPYGWHIIKLIDRKGPDSFEYSQEKIQQQLRRSAGSTLDKDEMIRKLKERYDYLENDSSIIKYFVDHNVSEDDWFCSIQDEKYGVDQFREFIWANGLDSSLAAFEPFVEHALMEKETSRITEENPEVKYLIREYDEGLLLFEIMEDSIWNKAVQDSVGMVAFFNQNRHRYEWNDRLSVASFQSPTGQMDTAAIRTLLSSGMSIDDGRTYAEENGLIFEQYYIEKGSDKDWESLSENSILWVSNSKLIVTVERLPARQKELEEVRGQVIADYQDFLDNRWIAKLRDRHFVNINDNELKKIYKQNIR